MSAVVLHGEMSEVVLHGEMSAVVLLRYQTPQRFLGIYSKTNEKSQEPRRTFRELWDKTFRTSKI